MSWDLPGENVFFFSSPHRKLRLEVSDFLVGLEGFAKVLEDDDVVVQVGAKDVVDNPVAGQ